jgi:ribonuclease Y
MENSIILIGVGGVVLGLVIGLIIAKTKEKNNASKV